eukprot:12726879-Alexandrium_andersonii.AAC.1
MHPKARLPLLVGRAAIHVPPPALVGMVYSFIHRRLETAQQHRGHSLRDGAAHASKCRRSGSSVGRCLTEQQ